MRIELKAKSPFPKIHLKLSFFHSFFCWYLLQSQVQYMIETTLLSHPKWQEKIKQHISIRNVLSRGVASLLYFV